MKSRLLVPQQDGVQTLKSYGIKIDTRGTSRRTDPTRIRFLRKQLSGQHGSRGHIHSEETLVPSKGNQTRKLGFIARFDEAGK